MRFNLKNRPRFEISPPELSTEKSFVTDEVERWFEAFEKELQEKLAYVRSYQKTCVLKDKPMFAWEESVYREILGEDR